MATKIQLDLAINNAEAVQSIGQAKSALKELKSALAFGVDEKDTESIKKAEEAYRKLKDKVDDVNDSLKANADEGLTQVGNQFKYVKDRIFELDFTKANQGLKNLGASVKGISFGQIKEGIKTFGSSLGELGNVMKTALGPWGLLILAVVTVIGFLYSLKDTIKPVGQLFAWFGSIVENVVKFFTDLTDAMGLTTVARDKENESIRNSAELNENAIKGSYGRQIAMLEAHHKNVYALQQEQSTKLIAQYDKERKAASDKFYDIAEKEQHSKTKSKAKSKEYYDALNEFQTANQKVNAEINNQNIANIKETERLEKNAFQVSQSTAKANADAKLVNIKNESIKAAAAAKAAYEIELANLKENQKTDLKTDAEHAQEIINLRRGLNTKLTELNNAYRQAERQARIDQNKTEIATLELLGERTIDAYNLLKEKRLKVVDDEEKLKLERLRKGSEQYNAAVADAALKRKQIEDQSRQSISTAKTEKSSAIVGFLTEQITSIGQTDGKLLTSLMTGIAEEEYNNAKRLLDENKTKLGATYQTLLDTLDTKKANALKGASTAGETIDAAQKQSEDNARILAEEKSFLDKMNTMTFNSAQEHFAKMKELEDQRRKDKYDADIALAKTIGKDTTEIEAQFKLDQKNADIQADQDAINRRIQHNEDLSTKIGDFGSSLESIYSAFDAIRSTKESKNKEEEEKRAKERFNIHKALTLAMAIPQAALNIMNAWEGIAKAGGNPFKTALAIANLVATAAANVANIAVIASSQYKSTSSSASAPTAGTQAPSINLYGQGSQTNNLTAQNANQRDQQLRVYVVENDISQAQTNVGRYKTSVSLG